ncbi:MAG: MarC family protein [Coxiellaceae bacterium]|jgi:multiple antibiotic resistance protein|nr:MarC family protein [Coxiellaceae bacterium]
MSFAQIVENTLYFCALINPVSKILFLTSKYPTYTRKELFVIAIKSNIVALLILLTITNIGDFLLVEIFHVEIYSLSVAGGVILFIIGLTAVRKGKFFEENNEVQRISISDISIVPLAAPLIAGPGTMTAAITFASLNGSIITNLCITLAVLINLFCMLFSQPINRFFDKLNITGPIIRITGLIVTAVAMQMIFSGCSAWLKEVV